MAANEPSLDEVAWSAPAVAAQVGGPFRIHNNNVLFYFGESPFFDRTSNNQVVITQAQMPGRGHMIATREAFEDELRKRSGLEFMVASSQIDYGNADYAESNGRWVVRKQNRTKRAGYADAVTVLATYFVIGETIYMAPSMAKILSGKLLSITENINSFMSTACALPLYTPGIGHHYIDPTTKAKESVPGASTLPSRAGSRAASPGLHTASQGDIQMAESQDPLAGVKEAATSGSAGAQDSQALYESFQLFSRYGREHMDEDPLAGEPGNFSFTSNRPTAKARPSQAQSVMGMSKSRESGTPQPKLETPPPEKVEVPALEKTTKNAVNSTTAPKVKRRKSKAPTSPVTPLAPPSAPTSPLAP